MQEAIDASSGLIAQWDEVTNLLQEALQASGRSRSNDHDEKQATAMWKLNLEWTLGRIQEAKRRFLMEEAEALATIIDAGIENSEGGWQSLSSATSGKVEEATINAIAAYENAKQLASNTGAKSDVQARQLDWRISVLQGNPIHELETPDSSYRTEPKPQTPNASNPSSGDFQNSQNGKKHVFELVARKSMELNSTENVGLVVGATIPEEIKTVRRIAPELPFLIPGVGAQGGDLEKSTQYGNENGLALISISRGIIFSGDKTEKTIRSTAKDYKDKMMELIHG